MSPSLSQSSARPLAGRTVVVTRARRQSPELVAEITRIGGDVVCIPTIEVTYLGATDRSRAILSQIGTFDTAVFTAANSVIGLLGMSEELEKSAAVLRPLRLCAVGVETANVLAGHGLTPRLITAEYDPEDLVRLLGAEGLAGAHVLLVRAKQNVDNLPKMLTKEGATVETLAVYEYYLPAGTAVDVRRLFASHHVDVLTFTGTGSLSNFAKCFNPSDLVQALKDTVVACMGSVTAQSARDLGLRVDVVAAEYSAQGLADAIARHFALLDGAENSPARG